MSKSNTHLHTQYAAISTAASKIHLSILSVAVVDALGGPAEFQRRFSFPLLTTMVPNRNFGLQSGVWTDDTSMTLCLARSLCRYRPPNSTAFGGFDETHQLDAYLDWREHGVLSATGECFDIGNTIRRALSIWSKGRGNAELALDRIRKELSDKGCAGNGSLMRILPVGLAYWRDETAALSYARRSSAVTHPNALCMEACAVWTSIIVKIMTESQIRSQDGSGRSFSKFDLLQHISNFPFQQSMLRNALSIPSSAPSNPGSLVDLHEFYWNFHPLLRLIASTPGSQPPSSGISIPPVSILPSTGYVLHTLVAALYCFFATNTFEAGAILAVNLGDDADTVGAVYGGLAGCWYASELTTEDNIHSQFWSPRVKEWISNLVERDLIDEVTRELVHFSEILAA